MRTVVRVKLTGGFHKCLVSALAGSMRLAP
jgi:hypothetical protein